ncbi:hypothetical protein [Chryseobacterium sp. MP_3.2]|uniref:hypothetical protein n=1 Tax=Chryseobacterium sp. MP_3.2 TaxID=3071712 RepID=UPI002DF86135|nr:hypothetical protein [Chryseobacterium sp. MP_3.2]
MTAKIMMLVLMILLTSCRSRKKNLEITEYRFAQVEKIDTNTVISNEKAVQDKIIIAKKIDQTIKENDGDIVIKGKTDSVKDFRFSNVVGNDTISDIYISGNADFIIKNRWKQTEKKEVIEEKSEHLNIVAEIARKSVAQSTIKEVAEEFKSKKVDAKTTGFSFPMYLIIAGAVAFLILLFFLWKKFGGSIVERINKFKNKIS